MRLDKTSPGYHFPAERLSFSAEAKDIMLKMDIEREEVLVKDL